MTSSPPPLPPSLLILGGSTRAAAESAVRAGVRPICADRFGDVDLHRIATVLPVRDYPHGLLAATESLPPTPWLYVGAIENEPELIEAISQRHPLLGNRSSVLSRIRDPFWIERTLRNHGLLALSCLADNERPTASNRWLVKPLCSGGGVGIRFWGEPDGKGVGVGSDEERIYFQEWRGGRSISAIFIASSQRVEMIGMSEQLIGNACGAPTEFGYAGSIGPIELSPSATLQIQQIGTLLANEAKLLGLFGCDFILADDVPWLTEVNPRYTASVEVLERATNWPLLKWHLAANLSCLNAERVEESELLKNEQVHTPVVGKRIVFASTDFTAPDLEALVAADARQRNSVWQANGNQPLLSDVPAPGSLILAGWPICTVFAQSNFSQSNFSQSNFSQSNFAQSNNFATCRELLELRASAIKRWTES